MDVRRTRRCGLRAHDGGLVHRARPRRTTRDPGAPQDGLRGRRRCGAPPTSEGRQAIDGVRKVRDALRDTEGTDAAAGTTALWEQASDDAPDNTLHSLTPVEITPGGKVAIAVGAVAVLRATTAFAVVGEKGAYRWGERMRARGVRAPHLRVGLVLGAAAATLGGLVPASVEDV